MNIKYIIGIVVVIALALGVWSWQVSKPTSIGTSPQVCTQEAKQCPDGSYVGRTGPNCAFALCSSPSSVIQKGSGRLQGSMTIGPICPVEQAGHPCTPTPQAYASHQVYVYSADRTKLITRLTPDAQGKFSTTLLPGTYLVDVEHPRIGGVQGAPTTVQITAGKTATVIINIDTGIR